ncbi:MAG: NfeD family protein [Leptospirillum sp.]|jgi:membrane-bound serine protease (ClpP class)
MVRSRFFSFVLLFYLIFPGQSVAEPPPPSAIHATASTIWLFPLTGAVGPPMANYLHRWFEKAKKTPPDLIILQIDTPGGLSRAMRSIVQDILASPVPVVGYVAPGGARAASAGTYILYACPLAAMAEGTNVGSATPILIGGSLPLLPDKASQNPANAHHQKGSLSGDTEERKIENDAAASIRSLAEMNGRNVLWAEKAVRQASNLSAREALSEHVINIMADDIPHLLANLDGKTMKVQGRTVILHLLPFQIKSFHPDFKDQLLAALSRPDLAYVLFLLGILGLAFEFSHPGFILPGFLGAISLLLAAFAFMVLPVSWVGLLLILLGIFLMVSEVMIGAFGLLGIAGIVSFFLGSLFLYRPALPQAENHPTLPLIILLSAMVAVFFLGVLRIAVKSRFRPEISGKKALIGEKCTSIEDFQEKGRVKINSEIWWATSPVSVKKGEELLIVDVSGLTLRVKPILEEIA